MTKQGGLLRAAVLAAVLTVGLGTLPGYAETVEVTGETAGSAYGLQVSGETVATGGDLVIKTGGVVNGSAYGGYAEAGDADENKVTMEDGQANSYIYGGYSEGGNANENKAFINGGAVYGTIYGGYSNGTGKTAVNNRVEINGGTMTSQIYGGFSKDGVASDNKVIISDGTINFGRIIGGRSDNSNAEKNEVTISGGTISTYYVTIYGGDTDFGNADHNTVTISGGSITGSNVVEVIGGRSDKGKSTNNTVKISGNAVIGNESVAADIYGGYSSNNEDVTGNTVTVSGGTVNGNAYGGYAGSYTPQGSQGGTVKGNTVTASGGTITGNAYGGYAEAGVVTDNTLEVKKSETASGTITGNAYGGYAETGNAIGNHFKMEDGVVGTAYTGSVDEVDESYYGGYSSYGSANENTVDISGGAIHGSVNGGWAEGSRDNNDNPAKGDAKSNVVTITGGTINDFIYGGFASNGRAEGNRVDISGGIETKSVYGGAARESTSVVTGNTVTISGGTIGTDDDYGVYGGMSFESSVNENDVIISGGNISGGVIGGYAGFACPIGNTVTISGGTIDGVVAGGVSFGGAVDHNTVTIKGGIINGSDGIYGGYSDDDDEYPNPSPGDVTENAVLMTGGTTESSIYGGYAGAGDAIGNHVTMERGSVGTKDTGEDDTYEHVYGGWSSEGSANENTVAIKGGTVYGSIDGGRAEGDNETTGGAKGNIVTITGGTMTEDATGGYSYMGTAEGNIVTMSGGKISGSVYGGDSTTKHSIAAGNTVTISGDEIGGSVYGGHSLLGTVTKNTVKIEDGIINGAVMGGSSDGENSAAGNTVTISGGTIKGGAVMGGMSNEGTAEGNTVTISGGTINSRSISYEGETITIGYIAGGYSLGGTASNNTVNILGGTFDPAISLYGGYGATAGSGNTLNMFTKGITVKELDYFQNLNFYIPSGMTEADTMLNVTGTANISGAGIKAGIQSEDVLGSKAKTITLLKAGTLTTDANTNYGLADALPSLAEEFSGKVTLVTPDYLTADATVRLDAANNAVLMDLPANPEAAADDWYISSDTKLFAETRAAGAALVGNGSDAVSTMAYSAATAASAEDGSTGFVPYASIGGFNLRNETGSYVDTNGLAANLGFVRKYEREGCVDTLMPFFEYGKSNYTSHLDSGARADGKQHYTGGGILYRRDRDDGLHYEAMIRAGRLHGDFSGLIADLPSSYESNVPYIAAEAGLGKVVTKGTSSFDYYGKFFYTRLGSDTAAIRNTSGLTSYDFDTINSYRTRLGVRWTKEISETQSYYAGIGWDYEFDSEARASYRTFNTPTPSMEGGSGFLELGWKSKITKENPWGADLHITGWAGKQRGVTYTLGLSRAF